MAEKKEIEVINIREIAKKIRANKKSFYLPLGIVFVLSCIYIFSLPRFYATDAKLAPETEGSMSGGTLGSIASSFGIDLGDMQTSDAINPLLYPDLMEDNAFVMNLSSIEVETMERDLKTNYFEYLKKHQKKPWWTGIINAILPSSKPKTIPGAESEFNPYILSEKDNNIIKKIQGNITLSVDKKTGVITINVKDQDPRVCKILADSVTVRLRDFITHYRTNKARADVEYYTQLVDSAQKECKTAYQLYGRASDSNLNVVSESYKQKLYDLENNMNLKYQSYSMLMTQLQAARTKVQERTPAFTLLKGASIPLRPAGPKRVVFVLGMTFLAFFVKAFWMVRKDLHLTF